jgi:hypothetical protein
MLRGQEAQEPMTHLIELGEIELNHCERARASRTTAVAGVGPVAVAEHCVAVVHPAHERRASGQEARGE